MTSFSGQMAFLGCSFNAVDSANFGGALAPLGLAKYGLAMRGVHCASAGAFHSHVEL
jgi:hypothetical protein